MSSTDGVTCATCGFQLAHIDMACPNCLPGFYQKQASPASKQKVLPANWVTPDMTAAEAVAVATKVDSEQWTHFNDHLFQSCCDCGLSHRIDVRQADDGFEARFVRLDEYTAEMRKRLYPETRDVLSLVIKERDEYRALIAKGKGEWPKPGYVRDETWASWQGALSVLESIARSSQVETTEPRSIKFCNARGKVVFEGRIHKGNDVIVDAVALSHYIGACMEDYAKEDAEQREWGTEPRGCPTPGACSCPPWECPTCPQCRADHWPHCPTNHCEHGIRAGDFCQGCEQQRIG